MDIDKRKLNGAIKRAENRQRELLRACNDLAGILQVRFGSEIVIRPDEDNEISVYHKRGRREIRIDTIHEIIFHLG